MKRNKFVITIVLIALLSAMFGAGGTKPALAEASTLADVAGLTAWYKADTSVSLLDPAAFISGFSTVEYQTADLVVGTVDIPVYVDEYNPYVLVHSSGYILAFYPQGDPAAKMVDVIGKTLNSTLLEYAVVMVGDAGGVTVGDVSYYDFGNPAATNMLVLAETKSDGERAFSLQMPVNVIDDSLTTDVNEAVIYDYVYYDKSYGFYQTYLPEFTLNDVNFVLDNAVFVAPGYYGSIFGDFSPEKIDLLPGDLNAFTVNSGSTSAFGALVLTYSYTLAGTPSIVGADLKAEFTLAVPGTMGLTEYDLLPGEFDKTAPLNGAMGQQLNLTLDWDDSTSPNYEYCIDTTAPDSVITELDNCGTGWVSTPTDVSEATLSGLLFDTTYYWQVRASNSAGVVYADDGAWFSFTTEAIKAPAAFYKTSPVTGITGLSPNSVVLDWGESYGAYSYEYCVTETSCGEDDWVSTGADTTATATNLKFETTYNWQVRAVNTSYTGDQATEADGGTKWTFTTLDTFSKLLPANNALNQKTRLTLTWEKLGASTYEYCIDTTDDATCTSPATWVSTGTATKVTLRLLYGTSYYWQVRANNGTPDSYVYANDGETPVWWKFTTAAQNTPSKNVQFEKISPQDKATDILTIATLKWVSVGATKYEYCYDTLDDDLCAWVDVGIATSATITNLTYGTTYYWQVRATIDGVLTYADRGAFWEFTTTFNKLAPANNALDQKVNNLTLDWEIVNIARAYEYCLSTDEACAVDEWKSTGTSDSVTVSNLSYGIKYYWQVRADISTTSTPLWLYANGSPTALWRFTTEALEKFSPMDGEVDKPINITLEWYGVTDAIEYQYCLVTAPSCADSDWVSTVKETTKTITGLSYATQYYWQVRANIGTVDAANWLYADGSETAFWSFTTEDLVKISPVNGVWNQPIDITLDWGDVSAAIEYEYCLLSASGACVDSDWVSTGNTSFIKLTELGYSTTYYWQARANIGTETAPVWLYADGLETAFWYFTTLDEPVVEP